MIVRLSEDVVFMLLLVGSDIIGECCGGCYDVQPKDLVTAMSYFSSYFSHPQQLVLATAMAGL